MKIRKSLMTAPAVAVLVAGLGAAPQAMALSGLLYSLLPPLPDAPGVPLPLDNLPSIPNLPKGAIPNFVLQLPLPIPNIPLPALPIPPVPERNTIASCGPAADLTKALVVTQHNLQPNNQVHAFSRNADGSLCDAGVFNTGGGSDLCGIVCSSQDSVVVSQGYVLVANAGSAAGPLGNGSVSVMKIEPDKLTLVEVVDSGGPNPRSVSVDGALAYVANGGVYQGLLGPAISVIPANIQGYRFDASTGKLSAIAGAKVNTLDAAADPGQIGIMADHAHVVMSARRTTNAFTSGAEPTNIEVFALNAAGAPVSDRQYDVGVTTPFGFRTAGNNVYLSMGGPTQTPNLGASGAYQINADSSVTALTPAVHDEGTDTCWNAISKQTAQPYFYTSAFFDSQMGRWLINADGSMTLLNAREASSNANGDFNYVVGEGGIDMQIAQNSAPGAEFVYVNNDPVPPPIGLPSESLVGFRVNAADGTLTRISHAVARGLPNSGFGLWAL